MRGCRRAGDWTPDGNSKFLPTSYCIKTTHVCRPFHDHHVAYSRSTVFTRWCPCARPSSTRFLGSMPLIIPNGSSPSSAILHGRFHKRRLDPISRFSAIHASYQRKIDILTTGTVGVAKTAHRMAAASSSTTSLAWPTHAVKNI